MSFASKSELVKLQKTLGTDEAIAKHFKVTRQAVHQLRKKYEIPSLIAKNPERNEKIIALYNSGKTGTEIAEKMEISISQAYRIITLAGGKKADKKKASKKK